MTQAEELESGKSMGAKAVITVLGFWAACAVLVAIFWLCMSYLNARHAGLTAAMELTAAYMVCLMALVYGFSRMKAIDACAARSPAAKRYRRRQHIALSIYAVLLLGAIWTRLGLHLAAPLIWVVAAVPALPLVATIAAMGLYLREETDEFERTVMVESALWATGGVLVLSSVWGFLEMLGGASHVDSWVWFPAWCVLLGVANLLTRRRFA
jgi:hypothetical protein